MYVQMPGAVVESYYTVGCPVKTCQVPADATLPTTSTGLAWPGWPLTACRADDNRDLAAETAACPPRPPYVQPGTRRWIKPFLDACPVQIRNATSADTSILSLRERRKWQQAASIQLFGRRCHDGTQSPLCVHFPKIHPSISK
jgi:hypothetical protein